MIRNGLFFSAINLYYIYMEFEHFKVIIFFNIDDFVFLTSLFDPFLTSVVLRGVGNYLRMTPSGLFLSLSNLYCIYMEFEYFKVIIFFNIHDFVFLTPLWIHFDPFLTSVMPSGVCNYLKMISNGLFSSAINLYYIYMEFEHFQVVIFINIDDFVFLTPLWTHF